MNTARTRSIALIIGLALALPLVGTAMTTWGVIDRSERFDAIPVAIVNDDEIVDGDRPMAAGRALTDSLVHPGDDVVGLGWTVTDEQDAEEGLEDGHYVAVLTIPEDFSASVLSSGGDDPVSTELTLETAPAESATAAVASRVVSETAAATLGREITTAFVAGTLSGVDDLSTALSDAADGASEVADGAGGVSDGAEQLDAGIDELAGGLDQLETGAGEVAAGNERLAAGAASVSAGAVELGDGTATVASGTAAVSEATDAASAGSEQLSAALAGLAASCPPTASAAYCEAVDEVAQSAEVLASSSQQIAAGAEATASGAQALAASSATFVDGTEDLLSGAQAAASGADELVNATATAAAGADSLGGGSAELVDGASTLSAGASELASGLEEGAASAPTYTEDEIDVLAEVVTQPVTVASTTVDSASGWLPAVIAAVVLWLAAITTLAVGSPAVSSVSLLSPVSDRRLVLAVLRPRMIIAAVQGLAVTLVVAVAFGFDVEAGVLFGGFSILTAMAFTSVVTGLRVLLGRWGSAAIAVLTLLQVSTLSGVLPVETAPPGIAALEPFLPVPAFMSVAARLAGSSSGDGSGAAVFCILLWALAGAAFVYVGIRRRRGVPTKNPAESGAIGELPARMAT